jgi:hypothetical protein
MAVAVIGAYYLPAVAAAACTAVITGGDVAKDEQFRFVVLLLTVTFVALSTGGKSAEGTFNMKLFP